MKNKIKIEKYKVNSWYNANTHEFQYGIDVIMKDGNVYHCSEGSEAIFFNTRPEASAEVKRLNKKLKMDVFLKLKAELKQ